jgi:hypothetical protein
MEANQKHENSREYDRQNREKILAKKKIYDFESREKIRARKKAYREANKDKIRLQKRLSDQKHRKNCNLRLRKWREKNPEKNRANWQRRAVLLKMVGRNGKPSGLPVPTSWSVNPLLPSHPFRKGCQAETQASGVQS